MGSFFLNNATADFLLIIPSGNLIGAKGFQVMWSSVDLVLESTEITKVHKFDLLGPEAAMCVFTLGSKLLLKELKTTTSRRQPLSLKELTKNGKLLGFKGLQGNPR
tara:strand:+ start:217 stop:534 length:318 start_codon:yes stop_codon:yes gene_type:complete